MYQAFMMLILLGAFGGYAFFMMNKRKQALSTLGPALKMFLERTGYRHPDLVNAPVEESVRIMEVMLNEQYSGRAQAFEQRYVRSFHGIPLEYSSFMGPGQNGGSVMWATWRVRPPAPPRILWEVADRSLVGARKAIGEFLENSTREYAPRYPQAVQTGDPALDARFVFYGVDPNAVRWVLSQNPRLKELLLASAEVCLVVAPDEIFFSDPTQKNMQAGMGGTVGAMAVGFDMAKSMELQVPVHDRIAELLAIAARASA